MVLSKREVSHSRKDTIHHRPAQEFILSTTPKWDFPSSSKAGPWGRLSRLKLCYFRFFLGGSFYFAESLLPHNHTPKHHPAHRKCEAVARTPSEHPPSKTKHPARGCQAGRRSVKRARLAAPRRLTPGRRAAAASSWGQAAFSAELRGRPGR